MISSLACTCSASHILVFHYPLKMSGLTGESQTPGRPHLMGLADDNIWTERTLGEASSAAEQQTISGRWALWRVARLLEACGQLATSVVLLEGPLPLPPSHPYAVCVHTHTHPSSDCDKLTNSWPQESGGVRTRRPLVSRGELELCLQGASSGAVMTTILQDSGGDNWL